MLGNWNVPIAARKEELIIGYHLCWFYKSVQHFWKVMWSYTPIALTIIFTAKKVPEENNQGSGQIFVFK